MPKIGTVLVQNNEEYAEILHRKLFPVNIRLYKSNRKYALIIRNIIGYMEQVLFMKFSDYPTLRGLSGANIGIPFNIVLVKEDDDIWVLINPEIIWRSKKTKVVKSNCGSLNLDKKVPKERSIAVKVKFFNIKGEEELKMFKEISTTVQHEIDHNNGILITN